MSGRFWGPFPLRRGARAGSGVYRGGASGGPPTYRTYRYICKLSACLCKQRLRSAVDNGLDFCPEGTGSSPGKVCLKLVLLRARCAQAPRTVCTVSRCLGACAVCACSRLRLGARRGVFLPSDSLARGHSFVQALCALTQDSLSPMGNRAWAGFGQAMWRAGECSPRSARLRELPSGEGVGPPSCASIQP